MFCKNIYERNKINLFVEYFQDNFKLYNVILDLKLLVIEYNSIAKFITISN